jgi:hypothetical protein
MPVLFFNFDTRWKLYDNEFDFSFVVPCIIMIIEKHQLDAAR